MTTNRASIRQALLDSRSQLSLEQRWQKSLVATQALCTHRIFRCATNIGLYVSVAAECPSLLLSITAASKNKNIHYPMTDIRHAGRMHFVRQDVNSQWSIGKYGIPEPRVQGKQDITPPRLLDLIILPLLGFDDQGNRIGMGAGYYDRYLAFRKQRLHWRKPRLIGLAYDCQQTDRISPQPWDVPLDGIATESGLKFFKQTMDN